MFIVIEGPDGVGKGTLIKMLGDELGNTDYYFDPGISHNPEHEKWQYIRNFIKNENMDPQTETLMFYAMRNELTANVQRSLDKRRNAICDRYDLSTYIYQGMIKGQMQFINKMLKNIEFLEPDVTFILNAPWEICCNRMEKRHRENDNIDKFKKDDSFRHRVWEEYQNFIRKCSFSQGKKYVEIDASGTPDQTLNRCMNYINHLKRKTNVPFI